MEVTQWNNQNYEGKLQPRSQGLSSPRPTGEGKNRNSAGNEVGKTSIGAKRETEYATRTCHDQVREKKNKFGFWFTVFSASDALRAEPLSIRFHIEEQQFQSFKLMQWRPINLEKWTRQVFLSRQSFTAACDHCSLFSSNFLFPCGT